MRCTSCGTELTPPGRFCPACGASQAVAGAPSSAPQPLASTATTAGGPRGREGIPGPSRADETRAAQGATTEDTSLVSEGGATQRGDADRPSRRREGIPSRPLSYQVVGGSAFACARVELGEGQSIRGEAGAMVSMSANVELESKVQGGLMGALKRMMTRESIFVSSFTARGGAGEVLLGPAVPGDVVGLDVTGRTLLVQSSSWLGSEPDVALDTQFAGFRGLFSGEGLFFIQLSGRGTALLSSYGALVRRPLPPGARYVVDTGHVVAFDARMGYTLRRAARSGWIRSFMSGEALVAEFTGPGDLWLQTRNLRALAGALFPLFPTQQGQGLGKLFE